MADPYIQMSALLPLYTQRELDWWVDMLEPTESREYGGVLVPRGLLAYPDVEQVVFPKFVFCFQNEWKIWFYSDTSYIDVDALAWLAHRFFKWARSEQESQKERPADAWEWSFTWAQTYSLPISMTDEIFGGIAVADADGYIIKDIVELAIGLKTARPTKPVPDDSACPVP